MEISYNKLWKLLIDRRLNKSELRAMAHLSSGTMAKLGKNKNVTTDVLVRICAALKCDVGDIMEIAEDTEMHNRDSEFGGKLNYGY